MFSRQFIRLATRSLPKTSQRMLNTTHSHTHSHTHSQLSPFLAMVLSGAAGGALLVTTYASCDGVC
jgi:hypothetical protein